VRKAILISVIIAAFVLPNPFQTASYFSEPTIYDQKDRAEKWLKVADLFWAERDFDKALIYVNKSLSHFPLERALWRAVNVNSMNQEYFSVYLALSELDTLGVNAAIGQRGYINMRQSRYERGIEDLIKYKALNGAETYLRDRYIDHYIAMAYHLNGDYNEAIDFYNSCITKEGEDWTVVYNFLFRGLAEQALGENERAVESYKKMNELCAVCPDGHYFLAELYRELELYDEAQMEYADAYMLRHNISRIGNMHNVTVEDIERQWLMYGKTIVMAD